MNTKRGFTLIELLVVMAIIAILASIVVPNVARYISRARMTRALEEIKSIELELTNMLTNADRSSLDHLFLPAEYGSGGELSGGVQYRLGGVCGEFSAAQMALAQELYTNTLYALLRSGRAVLTETTYSGVLRKEVIRKLGTGYLDIGRDPWGKLYQIWPGPWPSGTTNRFRIYQNENEANPLPGVDRASGTWDEHLGRSVVDPGTDQSINVGWAAGRNKVAFVWSMGQNLISGQAIYVNDDILGCGSPGPRDHPERWGYDANQDSHYVGGGDDINNWDNGRSWEVFYN